MVLIELEYREEDRRAYLNIDNNQAEVWKHIKRVLIDETEEYIYPSNHEIAVPWWVFLLARTQIGFTVRRFNVHFQANADAKEQMRIALQREQTYQLAVDSKPILRDQLNETLRRNGFKRTLYPYQEENVQKLISLPSGATFSVPGAGKTTEALAVFSYRKPDECKLLIVAPKNAFAVWEEELGECIPDIEFRKARLRGGIDAIDDILNSAPDVMLTTYAQFQSLDVRDSNASLMETYPTMMFLDESHHMKRGLEGIRGRSILGICHLPVLKLIMTGTPLPNSPKDLIAQFNFLYPEIYVNENDVVEKIRPIYVRTTKDQLELPDREDFLIPVSMSPAQRRLYDAVRREETLQLEKIPKARQRMLLRAIGKSMMKLLQLASNPSLLALDLQFAHPDILADVLAEGDSPKMDWTCRRTRELASKNKKVIIWSSFIRNVELLAYKLSDLGAVFIHGGVEAGSDEEQDTREGRIRQFKENDDTMVFIANPAAGGEGISLHKVCQHAIYLDRTYNAAHFLQSIDRIHRLGLKPDQHPQIEILMTRDTIDESVQKRLDFKIQMMSRILEDESLQVNPIIFDIESGEFDIEDGNSILNHIRGDVYN